MAKPLNIKLNTNLMTEFGVKPMLCIPLGDFYPFDRVIKKKEEYINSLYSSHLTQSPLNVFIS